MLQTRPLARGAENSTILTKCNYWSDDRHCRVFEELGAPERTSSPRGNPRHIVNQRIEAQVLKARVIGTAWVQGIAGWKTWRGFDKCRSSDSRPCMNPLKNNTDCGLPRKRKWHRYR